MRRYAKSKRMALAGGRRELFHTWADSTVKSVAVSTVNRSMGHDVSDANWERKPHLLSRRPSSRVISKRLSDHVFNMLLNFMAGKKSSRTLSKLGHFQQRVPRMAKIHLHGTPRCAAASGSPVLRRYLGHLPSNFDGNWTEFSFDSFDGPISGRNRDVNRCNHSVIVPENGSSD